MFEGATSVSRDSRNDIPHEVRTICARNAHAPPANMPSRNRISIRFSEKPHEVRSNQPQCVQSAEERGTLPNDSIARPSRVIGTPLR